MKLLSFSNQLTQGEVQKVLLTPLKTDSLEFVIDVCRSSQDFKNDAEQTKTGPKTF